MCGIAGYIGRPRIDFQNVTTCRRRMNRRGPDSNGVYQHTFGKDTTVCLLHSRLAIIDLEDRANQPIKNGTKVFVFNGELYNYLELKQDLMRKGEIFDTESDTEVFLKSLSQDGKTSLDRCEGMWAFALYDENDGSLTLSRDRFGEKPLYYYEDSSGFYFGSEPKFIFALLGRTLPINFDQIYRYMVNGYKSLYKSQETFFEGLHELSPGHNLILSSNGEKNLCRYWKLSTDQDNTLSFDEAVTGTRERLIKSVELRLRSDVPLAFCMSGGVDSNALISIAKKILNYQVHGFTIVNSDERYAEQDLVNKSVAALDIRHTSVPLSNNNFCDNLHELVCYHDAPVYTISYYVHWLLMKHIGEYGYKISISGTGADELFSGYYDHHALYLLEVANSVQIYKESLANWNRHIKPVIRNPFLQDPNVFLKQPGFRDHIYLDCNKFAQYLKRCWREEFSERQYDESVFRNRMMNELFHESVPVILHEDDLNAMYFSIENRSPYLDKDLFEFSRRIPTKWLIREGYAKAVLREAVRSIAPDEILDCRKKVGFNAPILDLLHIKDPLIRSQLLDKSPIFDHIKREKIETLISKDWLPNSESKFLFYFLCSKIFIENYSVQ